MTQDGASTAALTADGPARREPGAGLALAGGDGPGRVAGRRARRPDTSARADGVPLRPQRGPHARVDARGDRVPLRTPPDAPASGAVSRRPAGAQRAGAAECGPARRRRRGPRPLTGLLPDG